MAEFEIKCPHCQTALLVRDEWIGMETECPSCKQKFTIRKNQPGQMQYGQPQYGYQGQAPYGQPGMNYGFQQQCIGAQFQLMPGEFIIYSGNIQHCEIPVVLTTMRLTNQRICFCDIPFVLTFLFWIFWFIPFNKITLSLTRADIADMRQEPILGRKKVVITCVNGQTFGFASCWFSNIPVNAIMQWFHNPGL